MTDRDYPRILVTPPGPKAKAVVDRLRVANPRWLLPPDRTPPSNFS